MKLCVRRTVRRTITSIVQASESVRGFELWQATYDELGDELPRASVQLRWRGTEPMQAFGRKTGDGDERLDTELLVQMSR